MKLYSSSYYQGFISSKRTGSTLYLVKPASGPYLHARRVQTDSGIRVVSGEKIGYLFAVLKGA